MGQRDVGGSFALNEPAPAGFGGQGVVPVPAAQEDLAQLNLGSKSALESFAPSAANDPGVSDAAFPAPPPGYNPGYSAPARLAQFDNPIYRIGEILSAMGTPAGQIPVAMQLRKAQAEQDLEQSRNKLAWDTYYEHNRMAQDTIKAHNRQSIIEGMNMLPHFKGMVDAETDPVKRTQIATYAKQMLNNFSPDLGRVMDIMDKNPSHVFAADMLLKHPEYGPRSQELVKKMGYTAFVDSPQTAELADMMGHDYIVKVQSRFTVDEQKKLAARTMTGPEYDKAYDKAIFDESLGSPDPARIGWAKSLAHTHQADLIKAANGVQTEEMALKQQSLRPAGAGGNPMNARIAADYDRAKFKLDHAVELGLTPEEVDKLQTDMRVFDRLESKASPDSNAVNYLNTSIGQVSKGKFRNWGEYSNALHNDPSLSWMGNQAQSQAAQMAPSGQMDVKRGTPLDHKVELFSKKALQNDQLVRITKNKPSEEELNAGTSDGIDIPEKHLAAMQDLFVAKGQASQMFTAAKSLMTSAGTAGALGEKGQAFAAEHGIYVGKNADAWRTYQKSKQAWASRLARAIGTEKGVMTDTDVQRWENILPAAGDTSGVLKLKEEYFNKMYSYIKDISKGIVLGDSQDSIVDQGRTAYADPKVGSTINGILGDYENKLSGIQGSSGPLKSAADKFLEKHK